MRTATNGGKKSLNERLTFILGKIVKMAHDIAEERRAREERAKAYEEERQRREAVKRQLREEEFRREQLIKDAANWHASRRLRNYIDAVLDNTKQKGLNTAPDSETSAWIHWAHLQADRLDPLVPKPKVAVREDYDDDDLF